MPTKETPAAEARTWFVKGSVSVYQAASFLGISRQAVNAVCSRGAAVIENGRLSIKEFAKLAEHHYSTKAKASAGGSEREAKVRAEREYQEIKTDILRGTLVGKQQVEEDLTDLITQARQILSKLPKDIAREINKKGIEDKVRRIVNRALDKVTSYGDK